ncbi:MAG TPA: L-threonylcarbamoyladenylate synthase, partial [Kineosporiaceae bacterium]
GPSIPCPGQVRETAPVHTVPGHPLVTSDVSRAAAALATGGLVGLPTETVYGLAADASDVRAVARVYAVKGRPADHPLIVHIRGAAQLDQWAREVPGYARLLAEALWPGPLTLVLPRTARAGDHVTGGQPTVGLRAPSHPVAQQLLAALGDRVGLAAPSANRFGRVSPTTADHVIAELVDLLDPEHDVILDGGPSRVGVESAILDCTGPAPVVLRPGAVDAATVERVGGIPVAARPSAVRAPGTLASHYAPRARVVVLDGATTAEVAAHAERLADGLLATADVGTPPGVVRLSAPMDAEGYARVLYAALREADVLGLRRVLAVPPAAEGIGAAVRDRLARAAHPA